MQFFLEFANYYQGFIEEYLGIAAPLTKVIKKEKGFYSGKEQKESF